MFILSPEREADARTAFARYAEYLEQNRDRFPSLACALASSEWYFNPSVHHAPHDAWLESLTISEPSSGSRNEIRETTITIKLLGAYHDGHIELHYPRVFEYRLTAIDLAKGHGDWRYDEFRLDQQGRVIHEIQWTVGQTTETWVIVASDVQHKWLPIGD